MAAVCAHDGRDNYVRCFRLLSPVLLHVREGVQEFATAGLRGHLLHDHWLVHAAVLLWLLMPVENILALAMARSDVDVLLHRTYRGPCADL